MEIVLNYNEIAEIKNLIKMRLDYYDILIKYCEDDDEYQYYQMERNHWNQVHQNWWKYYEQAAEEIGELPF